MKKSITTFLCALLAGLFFVGCAPQAMYYYGNYSQTLYSFKKTMNEKTLTRHTQELEKIIKESKKRNLPVPPGIYAELGYIHYKAKKTKDAAALFQKESALYPESRVFMDRLIKNMDMAGNGNKGASN